MNKQHLVIGSAGHVDHGKSSIIKSLTNIDPTRLKEEIEKNITIDIGFSYFYLDNQAIGIVDLPGHEKFVSNMIVGSSNIDMILFVIAADDGIMPQTIEHFDILTLLNIKHAIIILNKVDLVSDEILQQRYQEIKDFFAKTPFENSPIVKTSIYDENTISNLKNILIDYIKNNDFTKQKFDIFRMAIDRSFTIKGQGTIVTGTSQGKDLSINDTLELYPSKKVVKIRNIQNHNKDVKVISANHRVALQLANINKNEIKRGDFLASVNSLQPTRYLDVIIKVLKSSKPIKNNQLIRVYHQTKEHIARIKLIDKSIGPNQKAFATIILQSDIYALKNDLAIVRFFSPIKTIAGIEIVGVLDKKPKITDNYYEKYYTNDDTNQIINYLTDNIYANLHQLKQINKKHDKVDESLKLLITNNKILVFNYNNKEHYILNSYINNLKAKLILIINSFHKEYPLYDGMPILKLHEAFNNGLSYKVFKSIIALISEIRILNDVVALKSFKVIYSPDQKARKNSIMTFIKNNGYSLLTFDDIYDKFNEIEDKIIIQSMLNQKLLLIIDSNYLILDRMYSNLITLLQDLQSKHNKIYLSDFKKSLDISRKYCIMYLEHFDNEKITKRIDDYRILNK